MENKDNNNDKELKRKVLESEYVFKRPWLTARKDKLQLADGRINPEYYVLEYPDWVNMIALTEDGKFIMERQYRHGIQWTGYEIPAGVIEEGETPLEAAKRELWEETGYIGENWEELMVSAPNSSTCNNYCHSFIVRNAKKKDGQHTDPTEEITVHLLTFEEVKNLLLKGEIKQALMLAPLWKYIAINHLI